MALHKDLPVYKLAYDLLSLATDLTRNMPRDFKASLGGRLRDECLEVLVLVARANAALDKGPHLTTLLEHLQVAELLLRLAHDKEFISHRQYSRSVLVTDSVGAQVGGWRKKMAAQLVHAAETQQHMSQGSLL
jgi:ribosome modulation factor